jgi:hypothetical protein
MEEALKTNPVLSLDYTRRISRYKNPAHLHQILNAYRKAGMPEKAPKAVP